MSAPVTAACQVAQTGRAASCAAGHATSSFAAWLAQILHFLTTAIFPHGSNSAVNFLWTVLTFLTLMATVGMVAKLFRREKGLTP